MISQLNSQQRAAILRMLNTLSAPGKMGKWRKDKLQRTFDAYNLEDVDDNLSSYSYYYELKSLPINVKRDIIHRIFLGWCHDCDYDRLSLHEALSALIYLKICSAPEYFFMNTLHSLVSYFGITREMWGDSYADYHYELNYGDSETSVQFNHDEDSDRLQIIISGTLLKKKRMFYGHPSPDFIEEILSHVTKQPFLTHCPWVYANGRVNCRFIPFGDGQLEIELSDLEYADDNGC